MAQVDGEQLQADAVEPTGRLGLVGKGVVYVVIAVLAAQIAVSAGDAEASTGGAIAAVSRQPLGGVLVAALAVALTSYAVWRLLQAIRGVDGSELPEPLLRLTLAVRAMVYAAVAVLAWRTVLSGASGSGGAEQSLTAQVLRLPLGRVAVAVVGVVVIGVGAFQVRQGIQQSFADELPHGKVSAAARRWLERLGTAGLVARGLVFALAGAFLVRAAIRLDIEEGVGLDGALRQVAGTAYGTPLLLAAAVGLLLYGIFCFAQARYAHVDRVD